MKAIKLKPEIFKQFPKVRSLFVVGLLEPMIQNLRKKFLVATMKQLHSGRPAEANEPKQYQADALYSKKPGIFLAVRSADCLPVLFFNPKARVIGVVHAGWKGTAKRILQKTVRAIVKKYHTSPKDFYFFLGPAARVCCYEFANGKYFLDFVSVNKDQLSELGVPSGHIEDSGICTIHNNKYPSHRRQGQKRHSTILSLICVMLN
ncbi:MAG: polyphenol oxidase family protein [bacterium]|nr:polyphenol oxidase family protein [bacterium]